MALTFITNFGDLAVLLPLIVVVGLWLLAVRRTAGAFWWVAAVGLCAGATAILKMYFYVCPPLSDLHSPSGHTSLSTLVYGALTFFLANDRNTWQRGLIAVAGGTFIALIAISRILVQAHSLIEVGLGLAIGLIALGLFAWAYRRDPRLADHLRPLVIASVAIMLFLNGSELHAEDLLHRFAIYLDVARIGCA